MSEIPKQESASAIHGRAPDFEGRRTLTRSLWHSRSISLVAWTILASACASLFWRAAIVACTAPSSSRAASSSSRSYRRCWTVAAFRASCLPRLSCRCKYGFAGSLIGIGVADMGR